MKVRLFNLVAIATITLSAQGVAQQNDSLERALADINPGLADPQGNAGLNISGDFRARNRWAKANDNTNNRDVDTRVRLNFLFNVNEAATAGISFNGRESWGDGGLGLTPGTFDDPRDEKTMERAWVAVNSLMGEGGTAKIGRDYYTLGAGRILGTDEWDNRPVTQSGIWYDYAMDSVSIHFAMLNGVEKGWDGSDNGDDAVYIASFDWTMDAIEQLGPVHMTPYWMRNEDTGAEHETWLGVHLGGTALGVDYDIEYSDYEQGDQTGNAWYAGGALHLDALGEIPGITGGALHIAMSDSDDGFATSGATKYHNAAGFSDRLGAGGIWTADTQTTNLGLGFSPAEGWNGMISMISVESAGQEWDEIDVSVGHTFGGNVDGWFGYAMVDDDAGDSDTLWAVLELAF